MFTPEEAKSWLVDKAEWAAMMKQPAVAKDLLAIHAILDQLVSETEQLGARFVELERRMAEAEHTEPLQSDGLKLAAQIANKKSGSVASVNIPPARDKHPSHETRPSNASSFDEICVKCGATDITGGGWGELAEPCPASEPSASAREEAEKLLYLIRNSSNLARTMVSERKFVFSREEATKAIAVALEKRDREIERLRSMPDRREHEYLSDERLQAAEAKLARAIKTLHQIADEEKVYKGHGDYDILPALSAEESQRVARATIAEIEGE